MSQPTHVVYTHKKFKRTSSSQPWGGEPPVPEVVTPSSDCRPDRRPEDCYPSGRYDGDSYTSLVARSTGDATIVSSVLARVPGDSLMVATSLLSERQCVPNSETATVHLQRALQSRYSDICIQDVNCRPHQKHSQQEMIIFKCSYCNLICDTEDNFHIHQLSHLQTQNLSVMCSKCGSNDVNCKCSILSKFVNDNRDAIDSRSLILNASNISARHSSEDNYSLPADLTIHSAKQCNSNLYSSSMTPSTPFNYDCTASKSIYKPKFRASYSSDDAGESSGAADHSNEHAAGNDHLMLLTGTVHPSTCSPNNAMKKTCVTVRGKGPVSSIVTSKTDESVSAGKFSGIVGLGLWKDIKSPSPDLGEHIDKIIVQNQVIMDADNHLWNRKYRRQSSIGSSSSESDGSSGSRHRRYSVNEASKSKSSTSMNLGLLSNPRCRGLYSHEIALGINATVANGGSVLSTESTVSHSSNSPRRGISSTGHGVSIMPSEKRSLPPTISTQIVNDNQTRSVSIEGLTSGIIAGSLCSTEQDLLRQHILSKPESEANKILLARGHSLALQGTSIVPVTNAAALLLVCPSCSASFRNRESLQIHIERHCDAGLTNFNVHGQIAKTLSPTSIAHRTPAPNFANGIDQEVAMDLQKKITTTNPGYFRGTSIGADIRLNSEPIRIHKSLSPFTRQSSLEPSIPPYKKRRLSSDPPINEATVKPASRSIFLHNGIVFQKSNISIKTMEEHRKPSNNLNQLCGGNVKINDGNECKTMKIDTSEANRSLAMDMCITDNTLDNHIDKTELPVPTSLVVTLSKSGLNCGGTVVESRFGSFSKVTTSIVSSPSKCTTFKIENPVLNPIIDFKLSKFDSSDSESGLHNLSLASLQQYAPQLQLPNLSIPGVPTPNFSNDPPKIVLNQLTNLSKRMLLIDDNQNFHSNLSNNLKAKNVDKSQLVKKPPVTQTILSLGREKVPYVPGIPGPYSQASSPTVQSSTNPAAKLETIRLCSSNCTSTSTSTTPVCNANLGIISSKAISNVRKDSVPQVNNDEFSHILSTATGTLDQCKSTSSLTSTLVCVPPSTVDHKTHTENNAKVGITTSESSIENNAKVGISTSESTKEIFLMPRKRPDTLPLKPQQFVPKSSTLLIGSTIMSPDTPRPKKSCAQLLLNGSAYTYLGLKVSTKTYYCCIYRPQPMYVTQSTDSKLSMYSIWQIRKPAEDNPFNLSISESMGLYKSRSYTDTAYTVAKPRVADLVTYSDEKVKAAIKKISQKGSTKPESSAPLCFKTSEAIPHLRNSTSRESREKSLSVSSSGLMDLEHSRDTDDGHCGDSRDEDSGSMSRVKIFAGGFKSTEDYTYVRGRGRGRYVCETCGIRCKKPSMLKKHIRTHTNLRPYPCAHCTSRYGREILFKHFILENIAER